MKKINFCMSLIICGLCLPGVTDARQNSLQGSIGLDNDYRSNVFNTKSDHVDEWNSQVSPTWTVESIGRSDSLSLTYAPTFSYNHRRAESELEYGGISLAADKALSGQWQITVSDSYNYYEGPVFEANTSLSLGQQFLRADDATQAEIVRLLFPEVTNWDGSQTTKILAEIDARYQAVTINNPSVKAQVDRLLDPASNGQTRKRNWDNSFSVVSDYEFAKNSTLSLGYSIDVHDEKTGIQADSVSHAPSLSISYEISPQWAVQAGYGYGYTDYDTSDDSKSDDIDLKIKFTPQPSTSLYASYTLAAIDYEGNTDNSTTQGTSVGVSHEIDQQTSISGDLGFSYQARDIAADERDFSLSTSLSRAISRGSISANVGASFGETSSGGSWEKLNNSWNLGTGLQYDWSQDISTSLDFSYERRNSWTNSLKTTYDDLSAGAGVSIPFLQWFVFSVNYDYHLFDSTGTSVDDYDEHRVSVSLSASKELLRW